MHKLPTWAVWSIIPATVVLVPVVAFLTAIAIAMLLGALKEAGVPTLVALAEAGVIGCLLVRKRRVQPARSVRAETSASIVKLHRGDAASAGSR